MVRTYALAPKTVQRMMARIFWRFQIITTVSFLLFGLYLAFLSGPVRWERAIPLLVIVAVVYFFIIFFHYRTQLRYLYGLRFEIDGSSIVGRQTGREPVRISRADIAAVRLRKDGLQVETVDGVAMRIPYGLARDGDADFRETLGAWIGVIPLEACPPAPVGRLLLAGILGAALILLFANSLAVILPLLLATVVYGLYTERRLANASDSGQTVVRTYNMAFSFLIFVIAMKSCMIAMTLALAR